MGDPWEVSGTWILTLRSATSKSCSHLFLSLSFEEWGQLCHFFEVSPSPHHRWDWCEDYEEFNRGIMSKAFMKADKKDSAWSLVPKGSGLYS